MNPVLAFYTPGVWEMILILALVLILFGPKRLPEIAEAFGKSIRKFKSATSSATEEVKREIEDAGQELRQDGGQDKDTAKD